MVGDEMAVCKKCGRGLAPRWVYCPMCGEKEGVK